jgi:peptidoglycan/LPS O-acetylase OafA/YrhL
VIYRKEIDGLRAIAVVSVILFHANFSFLSGGFLGVDIFFVISGYLITHIIVAEQATGSFSLAKFYERRARRILPALFLVLGCCLPAAWLWLPPLDMTSFAQSLLAVATFSANIFFYNATGYFATAAEWKPLLHTWSLALEEQYYVLFPLLLLATRKLPTGINFLLLSLLTLLSLGFAHWGSHYHPSASFYLLHSRSWELLIGALVAYYTFHYGFPSLSLRWQQLGSMLGLVFILVPIVFYSLTLRHPSLYTLVPILGAVLIILFAHSNTLVGRLLGTKILVGIGLISYSAYLWHWPLFVFARYKIMPEYPSQLLLTGLALVALGLGYLSWKWVEQPFRHKTTLNLKKFTCGALSCYGFILAFSFIGIDSKGFSARIESTQTEGQPAIEFPTLFNGWCFYEPDTSLELPVGYKGTACWLGAKSGRQKAILLGDSFAGNYEPFWDKVGKKLKIKINPVTTNFCVPTRNEDWTGPYDFKARNQCFFNRHYFQENISRYSLVILGANWMDYSAKGKVDEVLDAIDFAAKNTRLVILMAAPKAFDLSPIDLYNKNLLEKAPFDITQITTVKDIEQTKANALLAATAQQYPNVIYIDRDSLFNIDGVQSDVTNAGIPYSFDGLHISTYGSLAAADTFLQSQKYKDIISRLHTSNASLL